MKEFVIVLYTKKTGEQPVKYFLDSLETKMQAKTLRMITLLRQNGYDLHGKRMKKIDG
ncbi:MAG: hypothetical protein HDR17_10905 [Lachnospiraceae bacterium]|nr:hypothetical protein [Lachnospiraceae bacterium]